MLDVKDSALSRLVCGTVVAREPHDLALGHLRYEAVRKLSAMGFKALLTKAIVEDRRFDDLVDELVLKEFV